MPTICLPKIGTVAAFRIKARALASQGIPAHCVIWKVGESDRDLFAHEEIERGQKIELRLSRSALFVIEAALCHKDPGRFARCYALVLRLANKSVVWGDRSDPDMRQVLVQAKSVGRDIHKMHAFVRFRDMGVRDTPNRDDAQFEPATMPSRGMNLT